MKSLNMIHLLFKKSNVRLPVLKPNGVLHGFRFSVSINAHNCSLSQSYYFSSFKRSYSGQAMGNGLPRLTDLPIVYWPSFLNYAKNAIISRFIIQRRYDDQFDLEEFVSGSREAVGVVSNYISKGDLRSLENLVTPDVIGEIQQNLLKFSLKQFTELKVNPEDIYMSFPYDIGVILPEDSDNDMRFVEITMCYHVLTGFKEIATATNYSLQLIDFENNIYILNYRFFKDFSKGRTHRTQWIINGLNHCKPLSTPDHERNSL